MQWQHNYLVDWLKLENFMYVNQILQWFLNFFKMKTFALFGHVRLKFSTNWLMMYTWVIYVTNMHLSQSDNCLLFLLFISKFNFVTRLFPRIQRFVLFCFFFFFLLFGRLPHIYLAHKCARINIGFGIMWNKVQGLTKETRSVVL